MKSAKVGFGGGCHWCTEAYFQSLKGVLKVDQGWISSTAPDNSFSEAVIVEYDPDIIPLSVLVEIHLLTHASTKKHSLREKYRSAVYVFDGQTKEMQQLIARFQPEFKERIITEALSFKEFRLNEEKFADYYKKHREGVFCERYISPRLRLIANKYANYFKEI